MRHLAAAAAFGHVLKHCGHPAEIRMAEAPPTAVAWMGVSEPAMPGTVLLVRWVVSCDAQGGLVYLTIAT